MVLLGVRENVASSGDFASLSLRTVGGAGRLAEDVVEGACCVSVSKNRVMVNVAEG